MDKIIGLPKKKAAANLYKDGDVISVPFKMGKKLTLELPSELSKYLRLKSKKNKVNCILTGGILQISPHNIISHIPAAVDDVDSYIKQVE